MKKILKIIKFILSEPSNKNEKIKRLFYAFGWQLWKRIIKKPVIINLDNKTKYIAYPNTPMGSFPIYARIYDSEKILFLRKVLKSSGIMIDVGANMGIYSLLLKDKFDFFILFEPIKETASICEANLNLNRVKYKMFEMAVGNEKGSVGFSLKSDFDTTAKIDNKEGIYTVNIDKLDNIIKKEYYSKINFIKIDVEGFELEVLKGAENLIDKSSVKIIQFERLKTTPLEPILKIFKKHGWEVFTLNKDSIPSFDKEDIEKAHDLFAVRNSNLLK
jgi:FkbM family methyltransferase